MKVQWKQADDGFVESHCEDWRITPVYSGCTRPQYYELRFEGKLVDGCCATQREAKEIAESLKSNRDVARAVFGNDGKQTIQIGKYEIRVPKKPRTKPAKTITITVTAEHEKCSKCGHTNSDNDPDALYVEDTGKLFDGGEICEGDYMFNDAKIVVAERRKAYEDKGFNVVVIKKY